MTFTIGLTTLLACGTKPSSEVNTTGADLTVTADEEPIPATPRFARLTHVQWDNAARDLLRLPASPGLSQDFIGDALSEGFENDAETLQVAPELWQDYQRAAETLAASVVADPTRYGELVPQDPRTGTGGVEFSQSIEAEDPSVTATTGQAENGNYDLWSAGSLTAMFELPEDATYTVRTSVWADQGGPDLARASLSVDGVELVVADVAAESGPGAEELEGTLTLSAGSHAVSVAFLNDYYEPGVADRNLHVDWVAVEAVGGGSGASVAGDAERDAWIRDLGGRAHRRPLTEDEVDGYRALFDQGPTLVDSGDDFADGVQLVVTALLQSPHFLYRVEESAAPDGAGRIPLTSYEIASKLSFGLWNTMPDDRLFAAAAADTLRGDAELRAEAERMLADPRARDTVLDLHRQLLRLDNYANIAKDPTLYPEFGPTTAASMVAEANAFVDDVVFSDGGVHALLTSTRTFVNEDLARIYGLDGITGDGLVPVDLDPTERAGLLTLSGFLALEADTFVHSPIRRGVLVNHDILCAVLPPPPDLVPPLPPSEPDQTTRERVEAHTGDGTCGQGCHSTLINPIGFAYERYDAIGRYRTEEVGEPVDSSATYRFDQGELEYADAIELAAILGDTLDVHACYAGHWLGYLQGRHVEDADDATLERIGRASLAEDRPIREVIVDLVLSNGFRYRSTEVN